jgi:TonB family protein
MIPMLDATVKVSIIVLIGLAAVRCTNRQSASLRHWILAASIACAAVAPLLTLMVPSWRVDLGWASSLVSTNGDQAAERPSTGNSPAGATSGITTSIVSVEAADPARVEVARSLVEPLLWLWIGGLAAGLGLLFVGLLRLRWIESRATPVLAGAWTDGAKAVAREYGLRRTPVVLQSERPSLLVTWGFRRPTVLVPAVAAGWSVERIRVVLRHELAHIRRYDWVVHVAAEVVRRVYWFNPIVWIACRRMRQESEQACDDAVMKDGIAPHVYATHLLEIARTFCSPGHIWSPAPAIAQPSSLERRVRAMLNDRVNREPVTRSMAAAVIAVLLTISISVAGLNAFGQARFATLSGTAKDETGAVLTNATVTLTNVDTQAKYEVRSNQSGMFEFVGLPAGDYAFEVRVLGFEPVKDRVSIGVGESRHKDVALKVSTLQENITVTGARRDRPDTRSMQGVESVPRRRPWRPCPNPAVGGCIDPPVKLKDVRPLYPASLVGSGIEGTVVIEGLLGTDGRMKDMRVVSSSHPAFERSALDAVGAWEFTPTLLNGRTIDVRINVNVNFAATSAEPAPLKQ